MNYREIKELARKLRNNPTTEESALWEFLRNKKLEGRKFLRQHPIIFEEKNSDCCFFIPDFYCYSENIAIELDGKIHLKRKWEDKRRDEILNSKGIQVLRIKNEEMNNIALVLKKIKDLFKSEMYPSISLKVGE